MSQKVYPAILCGGSGTRLWPLSRRSRPKQLLRLTGQGSLLQATVKRFADPHRFQPPIAIAGEAYRFAIAEQMLETGVETGPLILEPEGRNTAPAAAVAALWAQKQDPDAVVLLTPSDHYIAAADRLVDAVDVAASAAHSTGAMVTFGIKPDRPETGYGYIKVGPALESIGTGIHHVSDFREKPDAATAADYLASGDYLWNSGIFLFSATRFLESLKSLEPAIFEACVAAVESAQVDLDFLRLDETAFRSSPANSIDYAVMEKVSDALVVPIDVGWSDLGSWQALYDLGPRDMDENVIDGPGVSVESHGCLIRSSGPLTVAYHIEDLVIVAGKDAVLVTPREKSTDLKGLVAQLDADWPSLTESQPRVYRPWGWFETMDEGPGFKVKRISVKPGHKLSLQKHSKRAEHWIVVNGTARVTKDKSEIVLEANESTFIPLGTPHRLENPGEEALQIIEVQSGSYLGEDDIERLDDVYGRN